MAGPGIRRIEELRSSDQGGNKVADGQKAVNVYTRLNSWKSSGKLVDDLHSNVVYYDPENDDSGLVVINKPHGLAIKPAKVNIACRQFLMTCESDTRTASTVWSLVCRPWLPGWPCRSSR